MCDGDGDEAYHLCVLVSDTRMDEAGVTAVAEALKVNTSVQRIELTYLTCEWCW